MKRIIALITILSLSACWNYTGENHKKAIAEAKKYVAALNKAGGSAAFVECMDHDTDNDGYLACTIAVDGQPRTIDCAGKSLIQDNHGCKDYVAKIRVTNTNTTIDNSSSSSTRR
jgi:hypothetical protein